MQRVSFSIASANSEYPDQKPARNMWHFAAFDLAYANVIFKKKSTDRNVHDLR